MTSKISPSIYPYTQNICILVHHWYSYAPGPAIDHPFDCKENHRADRADRLTVHCLCITGFVWRVCLPVGAARVQLMGPFCCVCTQVGADKKCIVTDRKSSNLMAVIHVSEECIQSNTISSSQRSVISPVHSRPFKNI